MRPRAGRDDEATRFVAEEADRGVRLDKLLAARVPGLSRGGARDLLDRGAVWVSGRRCKIASKTLLPGEAVEIGAPLPREDAPRREAPAPPLVVVLEDEELVVVDKPHDAITAPTREGDRGTLAWALGKREGRPVFVVHRLDLGTSGLLVFAKTARANAALAEAFRVHDVTREYLALAHGAADAPFEVDEPIDGRRAKTSFAPEERAGPCTLLRATLETGRTHQVRIHAASRGLPLVGDKRHGDPARDRQIPRPTRLFLHATRLGFRHPTTGAAIDLTSPLPPELEVLLQRLRGAS